VSGICSIRYFALKSSVRICGESDGQRSRGAPSRRGRFWCQAQVTAQPIGTIWSARYFARNLAVAEATIQWGC
jgi:hypothetical protein